MVLDQGSVWFEIWDGEELVGLIWLMGVHSIIDAEVHMAFFDRRPREKKPVILALMKWVFANYPLHRVTANVPDYFHAHHRFIKDLGLTREGVKREAVLSAGQWHDIFTYGLLRSEAEALQ